MRTLKLIFLTLVLTCAVPHFGQSSQTVDPKPRPALPTDKVAQFELVDTSFLDGVRQLTRLGLPMNIGIEKATPEAANQPGSEVRFSLRLSNVTVKQILDSLCSCDARYTWSTDGRSVNIYPKSEVGNAAYFFNRPIEKIVLKAIPDPDEALTPLDRQLPPPRQGMGCIQVGGDVTYAEPWSATLEHITVRQFINRAAEQLSERSVSVVQDRDGVKLFTFQRGGLHAVDSRDNTE